MPTATLILVYEPTKILIDSTKRLFDSSFTIVVVDGGGGPDYRGIFQQCRPYAAVLSYQPNRGKRHTLKTGYQYIRENLGADSVIMTMDPNGQHVIDGTQRIVKRAVATPGTLVLGVYAFGPGMLVHSQFGNTVARAVLTLSTGLRMNDTQTRLRSSAVWILPFLFGVPGSRYEYEMNVLLRCAHQSIRILEEPIQTVYRSGNRDSHFHALRDSFRIYKNILRFTASSFLAFCIDYGLYSVSTVGLAGLGMDVNVPVANIMARTVSASANFTISKRFVFGNTDSMLKTGTQYFLLAVGILPDNTVLFSSLVNSLGVNQFAAKLVTKLTFFILSWTGQRFWILRRQSAYAYNRIEESRNWGEAHEEIREFSLAAILRPLPDGIYRSCFAGRIHHPA